MVFGTKVAAISVRGKKKEKEKERRRERRGEEERRPTADRAGRRGAKR